MQMTGSIRFSPEDFPDSRYAQELQSGLAALRFNVEIEHEFVEAHLRRMWLRVRLLFVLGALFASAFFTRSLLDPGVAPAEPWLHALALVVHGVMLSLTFTPWFQRYYSRVGSLVIPLICVLCTTLDVLQLARGRVDLLMSVAMFPILIFFLAGLRFRSAAISVLLSVGVFLGGAVYFGMAPDLLRPCAGTLVATTAICALVAWDKEYAHRESFLEARLLQELAALDGLTGVKNRRAFDEHLTRVWQQALRKQRSLALMLIDCDHFKRYNDTRGHQEGDEALRLIARIVDRFARRPLDIAARYGGEEFALILYDIPESVARRFAEELRAAVEQERIQHDRSFVMPFMTVSVGVALVYPASCGHGHKEAVELADKALYTAKRSGRNHVSILQRGIDSDTYTLFRTA